MLYTIGIDEVGRGCWAGPLLVVAAQIHKEIPLKLQDSKKISKLQRDKLYDVLVQHCSFGEGWVTAQEIDSIGIARAMSRATSQALRQLGVAFDTPIIMDGNVNYVPKQYTNVKTIIKADATFPAVSVASIYAKVTRDRYMQNTAKKFPEYRFEQHVGYGTILHRQAIEKFGLTDLHRLSFKPMKDLQ